MSKRNLFLVFFLSGQLVLFGQSPVKKILFIGIDGCRSDVLMSSNTPSVQGLLDHAIYTTDGLCAYKTLSGNGWSSMLTGTWHTKHGVTDNTFSGANYASYPDFITRLEEYNPDFRTISNVHWGPINTNIIIVADVKNVYATDLEVKNSSVNYLTNDDPDILFVAFDDVDHAGHGYGFSPDVPEYVASIELTDAYVGEILTAMENRPNYVNEDWLVIITTDHGGTMAGHGGGTQIERTIFQLFSNPSFLPIEYSKTIASDTLSFASTEFLEGTYASPQNQAALEFGSNQDFTIEFWVKPTSFTGDPAMISNKDWDSGLNPGFVISAIQGPYWKVNVGDGSNRKDIQGGFLSPGEWHHLAVSFDRNGLMTAYENGAVVGFEWINAIGNINSGLPLIINQDGSTAYGYDLQAHYKDIRIWNTVLSNETLIDWALQPITNQHPNYSSLLANWTGSTISLNQLEDASPSANHCTITGTTVESQISDAPFTVYNFLGTPREPDNAVTALQWMCIPIEFAWDLDGRGWVPECIENPVGVNIENEMTVLYPNPASTTLFFSASPSKGKFEIINSIGQCVHNGYLDQFSSGMEEIDIQFLSEGIYHLRIVNSERITTRIFSVVR